MTCDRIGLPGGAAVGHAIDPEDASGVAWLWQGGHQTSISPNTAR